MRVGVIHYDSHAIFDRLEFFAPRCQICQLFIGHIFTRSVLWQKFKISVNIRSMCFCHLYHCVNDCTGIRTIYGTAEQPVLTVYCEWTDCILAETIGKAAAPVFQIGLGRITPVKNIINCFIHPGVPYGLLLVKPRPERLQNRFFLLETQLFPFFIITGIFLCFNILLVAAVWLVGDGTLKPSGFQEWSNNFFPKISLRFNLKEFLHFLSCARSRTKFE